MPELLGKRPRAEVEAVLSEADPVLVDKFLAYHLANPQVWERFQELSLTMARTGRRVYSAWVVINVMRWDHDLRVPGETEFKISNDFIGLYSRLFLAKYPEHDGFFVTKPMKKHRKH